MKDNSKIFVVGSKPETFWPDCVPHRVYAANGAIVRVQHHLGKAEVVGLITKTSLKSTQKSRRSVDAIVLRGARVDRLIIAGGARSRSGFDRPDQRQIYAARVEHMSRTFSLYLKLKQRAVSSIYRQARRNRGGFPLLHLTKDLVRTRMVSELAISTGVLALLLALHETRSVEERQIFLIGVGAGEGRDHFYEGAAPFGGLHVEPDREMLFDILRRQAKETVVITDPELRDRMSCWTKAKSA